MDSGSDFSSKDECGTRQKSPLWPLFPPSLRGVEALKPPAKRTESRKRNRRWTPMDVNERGMRSREWSDSRNPLCGLRFLRPFVVKKR